MAGNVPAPLLRDLHAIVASCHDALEHGVEGDLKHVRASLVECQITVQVVIEESARLLREEDLAQLIGAGALAPIPPGLRA